MQFVEIPMKLVAKVLQSEFVVSTQRFLCVYPWDRLVDLISYELDENSIRRAADWMTQSFCYRFLLPEFKTIVKKSFIWRKKYTENDTA